MKKCPRCSVVIQEDAIKCRHCNSLLVSPIPVMQNKRFVNLLLDFCFQAIFLFLIGIFIALSGAKIDDATDRGLSMLLALIYFVIFESIWSKTPAKFITKTKVIMKDGTRPAFGAIFLRTLCRFIPFDALSFLEPNPVGWHDKFSKTMVVNEGWEFETTEKLIAQRQQLEEAYKKGTLTKEELVKKASSINSRIIEIEKFQAKHLKKNEILKVNIKDGAWACPSCSEVSKEECDVCWKCGQEVEKNKA